jgi:hypothetical protein
MRTTVTLDPDTERLLHTAMRQRGITFKQALNDAIRAGLAPAAGRARRRFVQKTFRMGTEELFRWDKALAVSAAMEDEEIARKLSLGK